MGSRQAAAPAQQQPAPATRESERSLSIFVFLMELRGDLGYPRLLFRPNGRLLFFTFEGDLGMPRLLFRPNGRVLLTSRSDLGMPRLLSNQVFLHRIVFVFFVFFTFGLVIFSCFLIFSNLCTNSNWLGETFSTAPMRPTCGKHPRRRRCRGHVSASPMYRPTRCPCNRSNRLVIQPLSESYGWLSPLLS